MITNARHTLLVRTSPVPGREDEFARWYDEVHLAEVLAVPGFVSAQRFAAPDAGDGRQRYVVAYDIETDDIDATMARFERARPGMSTTPALDLSSVVLELLTAVNARVEPAV
jgi:antibiotic biosynthesis monooxygenase (ABM) superfamily enzyme